MNQMNEIIKKFNDTTYNNPDSVELNQVYDLIRSASQTTCEIAFPSSVVLEVCKIFLNKVFGFYVGDKVDDNSLKQHLLIIHTLLAIPQAGHEECITGVIQEIVLLIFDPSCNFWLCLHLVKLANKILIMQKNVFGKKNIGYGAIKNYHLCRLMDRLFTCGDYVLQSSILELLFRLKKDIQNLTVDFFPEDFDLQRALNKFNSETFDIDCRHFLNTVNQSSKHVFSLQAEFITANGRSLLPPSEFLKSEVDRNNNLWVDFNKDSHAITINVSLNSIVPVKLDEEDSDAVLIFINEHAIEKFTRKKLKKDDMNLDLLIVNLCHSIVINNRVCKKFAQKCKLIKIAFKSNSRVNLLHDEVLGDIFKNKCISKSNNKYSIGLNPLPINVVSNNSKSIYTSISEKSLGYVIRKDKSELNKDSEKFDTCPDKINVVSNSIELNIPKASRKKLTKSRRRKMSILDSISEDEEYHSQQLIHSTLKSGLVMVSTSVNFSDVTSIHSDSNKGTLNSRSAKISATNSRSDIEIDVNRCDNQRHVLSNSPSIFIEKARFTDEDTSLKRNTSPESAGRRLDIEDIEPIPSNTLKTMMQPPIIDLVETVVNISNQVQVPSSNSRLLASRTNSEVSKVSQGSRYNTRSSKRMNSAIVVLENMKLPINIDRNQIYNKTRKVSLSLRKRSSGRLSLPDEEKIIKTPERILATKNDLPNENEVEISALQNIENDSNIVQKTKTPEKLTRKVQKQVQDNLLQICENSKYENVKSKDSVKDLSSELIKTDVESKTITFSADKLNTNVDRKKSLGKIQQSVSDNMSETIFVSSKNIIKETKLVGNIKTMDILEKAGLDDIDIIDDSKKNTSNQAIKESSLNVKVFTKSPELVGSLKGSTKVNCNESLPSEKQIITDIEETTLLNDITLNQCNADEEVIENKKPSGKGRKQINKNKSAQESSKSNVDLNQPINKSQVIENYEEISSIADEVWSQADTKSPKKRRRQNKKISKPGDKQQQKSVHDKNASGVKRGRGRVAKNSSLKNFNAKTHQDVPEGAAKKESMFKTTDTSKNRIADLISEKSKFTNFDRNSTNVSLKSCTISSTDFAKKYTKLLQERSQINKTIFNSRQSQSESEITMKKSTKRRKLYNSNEIEGNFEIHPVDKPQSEYNEEQEEINELTQEEMDSKTYLFNKLISGEDSQTSTKLYKSNEPRTNFDEHRSDQRIASESIIPVRPQRSCASRKVDRKIEMSNCNKKMNDGKIRKKYVRRTTKKMLKNSTIPINSVVTQNEVDLFDKLCQTTNITRRNTTMRKHDKALLSIQKYELLISKIKDCHSKTKKLIHRLMDIIRHDQERMNICNE